MKVWIRDVGELPILDYPKNLSFYKDWQAREVRLVLRNGKKFLKVILIKDYREYEVKDAVAVDRS
jgi:putative transposase